MIPLLEQHRGQIIELCRKYSVIKLDVFGSATRDDFNQGSSDIDFFYEFKPGSDRPFDRYFGLMFDLQAVLGRKVDLVHEGSVRNPIFRKFANQNRIQFYAATLD